MAKIKPKSKKLSKSLVSPFRNYWHKNNYIIFIFGFVLLILGFALMSYDPWDNPISLSFSPLVLLLAYLVIFPASILYNKKKSNSNVSGKN